MATVISNDSVAMHSVDKYNFKIIALGSNGDEENISHSSLVEETTQENSPKVTEIDSSELSTSSKESLIESLMKKTDDMSSNFIKLQMKLEAKVEEYKLELEKTVKFSDKVNEQFGYVYNPDPEINESVHMGLTRNKMIYGKRFCPCFMVIGETKEEQKEADNRICPCKPAIEKEIPQQGHCHCGIFCTPEYAAQHKQEEVIDKVTHTHSRGLTKEECEILLKKEQLDGDELESLLEAKNLGFINFTLVDVREWMEWQQMRIVGTDALVPTTSFYEALSQIEDKKEEAIIVYCLTGSRSNYCMNAMKQMGYAQVSNLTYGIVSFHGDKESGA